MSRRSNCNQTASTEFHPLELEAITTQLYLFAQRNRQRLRLLRCQSGPNGILRTLTFPFETLSLHEKIWQALGVLDVFILIALNQ